MKLTITEKTTLRSLILDKNPELIEKLNAGRLTSDGIGYGIILHYVSGTVYCETLVGDLVNIQVEGLPLHDMKTLSMDIKNMELVAFDGDGEILVSFL